MEHIHHLQSFNLMLKETLDVLGIDKLKNKMSDYSAEELNVFLSTFLDVQNKYPISVPISANVHHYFHKLYGRGNNTLDQFYDFLSKIKSGEIVIP